MIAVVANKSQGAAMYYKKPYSRMHLQLSPVGGIPSIPQAASCFVCPTINHRQLVLMLLTLSDGCLMMS
jgi:hypothetical protein